MWSRTSARRLSRPDHGFDWAQRFDEAVAEQIAADPAGILKLANQPDYARAVPTPGHFVPLLYLCGLGVEAGGARSAARGYAMGSLAMTCHGVGVDPSACVDAQGAARSPAGVPAEQTNM